MKKKSEEDQVWDGLSLDTIQEKSGNKAARFPQYSGEARLLKLKEKLDKLPDNSTAKALVADEIDGRADGRSEGTAATKERAKIYNRELYNYVVKCLKAKVPSVPDGQLISEIANAVCTEEASSSAEYKGWNKRSKKSNAPFYSLRKVKRDVRAILSEAMRSAGVSPRNK